MIPSRPYLQVQAVTIRYGAVTALDAVTLDVEAGETVCLLGANGAGKTSLLKAIMGMVPVAGGSIVLDGASLTGKPTHIVARAGVGMVPEGRMVFGRLTVRENLLMGSRLGQERSRASAAHRLSSVLERFPALASRLGDSGQLLSGGEQQMVAVGRALLTEPKVLLLDEPSLGLAPLFIDEIFRVIAELRESGVTILLVEQNATMALEVADRAYVLQSGRIVTSGRASEIRSSDLLQSAYLGASL